jgi:hypothetical protein
VMHEGHECSTLTPAVLLLFMLRAFKWSWLGEVVVDEVVLALNGLGVARCIEGGSSPLEEKNNIE